MGYHHIDYYPFITEFMGIDWDILGHNGTWWDMIWWDRMGHNGISWDIMEYVYVHQQTYVYGCIHMYTYLLYKDRERERER